MLRRKVTTPVYEPVLEFCIDSSIETIMMQFSVGRERRLSRWLPLEERENEPERTKRKSLPRGEQVIEPLSNVDISTLPNDIIHSGFLLVHAVEKPRIDTKRGPNFMYYMARFVFARHERNVSPEWRETLDHCLLPELDTMCSRSCWRIRAFRNPMRREYTAVPGKYALSINFEAPSAPDMHYRKIQGTLEVADKMLILSCLPNAI